MRRSVVEASLSWVDSGPKVMIAVLLVPVRIMSEGWRGVPGVAGINWLPRASIMLVPWASARTGWPILAPKYQMASPSSSAMLAARARAGVQRRRAAGRNNGYVMSVGAAGRLVCRRTVASWPAGSAGIEGDV